MTVLRAIQRGDVQTVDLPHPERSEEGLVSDQQSSEASTTPNGSGCGRAIPTAEAIERRKRLRALRCDERPKARQWRITIRSGNQVETLDNGLMRLRRCQRRVYAWAEVLPKANRAIRRAGKVRQLGPRMVMLTLTYTDADGWAANQIRDFMKRMREQLGDALYGYAWVLEMQRRGAPHYHVLLYVKRGTKISKPDESGVWEHGSTRIETVRTPYYICKYTGKGYQKESLPKGARMFAVQIYKHALSEEEKFPFRVSAAPGWLRPYLQTAKEHVGAEVRWTRVVGGGWVIKQTGEFYASPWSLVSIEPVDSG